MAQKTICLQVKLLSDLKLKLFALTKKKKKLSSEKGNPTEGNTFSVTALDVKADI